MPKGALLHAHLDATVDAKTVMNMALKYPAMHINAPARLTKATMPATLPKFRPLTSEEMALVSSTSLTDASYTPNSWVCYAQAREAFAPELGGPAGFDDWLIGVLTINPKEAYETHKTVAKGSKPACFLSYRR
jgi:adenosine deaminase CECR1